MRLVKNSVDLVEVRIFYKSEKMSDQTVQPITIKTVALLSFHGCLIFRHFFCSFYNALGIPSPKN